MPKRPWLQPASVVRTLRKRLCLSQQRFAERLGVSRRTVIRGEQRGLEPLGEVRKRYIGLIAEADAFPAVGVTSRKKSRRVSLPKKRLRRARERLEAWKGSHA